MVPDRQPSRQPRGEARRRDILVATLTLVRRAGVAEVTTRSVAREAGVPLGSLSYYFAGRDDLLEHALLLHVEEEVARLRTIAERMNTDAPGDPIRAAQAFAEVLQTGDLSTIAQFELYLEAGRNPALRVAAGRCFAAYEEVVRSSLAAAGMVDPDRAAPLFVALADGLGLRRLATPETTPPLEDVLLQLFGSLTGAVATPAA